MNAPDDPVLVVAAGTDADADQASLEQLLAEIKAMQRSSSIDNEHFATAIRTCQAVLDTTIADIQLRPETPAPDAAAVVIPAQAQP